MENLSFKVQGGIPDKHRAFFMNLLTLSETYESFSDVHLAAERLSERPVQLTLTHTLNDLWVIDSARMEFIAQIERHENEGLSNSDKGLTYPRLNSYTPSPYTAFIIRAFDEARLYQDKDAALAAIYDLEIPVNIFIKGFQPHRIYFEEAVSGKEVACIFFDPQYN